MAAPPTTPSGRTVKRHLHGKRQALLADPGRQFRLTQREDHRPPFSDVRRPPPCSALAGAACSACRPFRCRPFRCAVPPPPALPVVPVPAVPAPCRRLSRAPRLSRPSAGKSLVQLTQVQ